MSVGTPLIIGRIVSRTSTCVILGSESTPLPSVTISLMMCVPMARRKSDTCAVVISLSLSNHLKVSGSPTLGSEEGRPSRRTIVPLSARASTTKSIGAKSAVGGWLSGLIPGAFNSKLSVAARAKNVEPPLNPPVQTGLPGCATKGAFGVLALQPKIGEVSESFSQPRCPFAIVLVIGADNTLGLTEPIFVSIGPIVAVNDAGVSSYAVAVADPRVLGESSRLNGGRS